MNTLVSPDPAPDPVRTVHVLEYTARREYRVRSNDASHAMSAIAQARRARGSRPPPLAVHTWTSRTTSAQWAAREGHASVIDAAGAIYVIGGFSGGTTYYNDVWASADGGATALVRTRGIVRGTRQVLNEHSLGGV